MNTRNLSVWVVLIASLLLVLQASAHTLFFKPASFYVDPGQEVTIPLLNGDFITSVNRIPAKRRAEVVILAPDGTKADIADEHWSYAGKISNLSTVFEQSGNYVIGLGTRPKIARITPENFNFYLRYEGLDDNAEERVEFAETSIGAAERYAKFAKAIIQVGNVQSQNVTAKFGHPVEIVPLVNPYTLDIGDTFRAQILKDGKPLVNELIYATHEGHYDLSEDGIFDELVKVRSNEQGEVEFVLEAAGRWYVRFIHLNRIGDKEHWYSGMLVSLGVEEPRIPYESLWATLTFEIRE